MAPERPERRVEALAGILVGFVAPGFDSWTRAPMALRQEALKVAQEALVQMKAKVEEIGL